ncbi:anthrone oxygenase family protein [Olivibacter domesticus]|uniref:Uncharacterized membrane protein n=1 Tax=Olivibacter domesticus TaxID=407022 RepID=A0A1H7LQD1_OLID1|nr:anthrone oxygenase family protein [Olivibacter domesticus]SEL01110.1 Uncharacterized membrane protein [Olivibacter domesticus]
MNYLLTTASLLSTALIAGLFFNWSNTIMPGLKQLSTRSFLEAMQSLNRIILNPSFLVTFLVPVALLPLSCYFQFKESVGLRFYFLLLACILYIFGVFLVTMVVNVPINDSLDKLDILNANDNDLLHQRLQFEKRWIPFNSIRAICAFLSLLCLIIAKIEHE